MTKTAQLLVALIAATGLGLAGCGGSGSASGSGTNTAAATTGGTGTGIGGGGIPILNPNQPGGGSATSTTGTGTGGTATGTVPSAIADAYVTDALNGTVEIFDLQFQTWAGSVTIPNPTGIGYDPGRRRVAVGSFDRQLHEIDTATRQVVQVTDLDSGPHTQNLLLSFLDPIVGFVVRPFDVLVVNDVRYIPSLITTKIVDVNGAVSGVMDLQGVSGFGSFLPGLSIPTGIDGIGAISAAQSGGKVYVANCISDTVTVIDTALVGTGQDPVIETIPIGMSGGAAFPASITADDTGKVYVACALSGEVAIIDTRAGNTVTYIPFVGAGPVATAFDPGTNQVYVGNFFDGSVVAIDTSLGLVVNTYQVSSMGSLFAALGLPPNMFQQALQQAFGGLGTGQGGTSAGGAAGLISSLFAGVFGAAMGGTGAGGGTNQGGFMTGLFSQLFGMAGFGGSGQGGLFGGLPVPGLTGLSVTRTGLVVASSALFGGCDVLDPLSGNVTPIASFNGLAAAGGMFPGWAANTVADR